MGDSLLKTFKQLTGNARGCVIAEPLWGIPFFLYAPYATVYMVKLGLVDSQIGLIATIAQIVQVFMALFSGVITDKLGRRRTTLIFGLVSFVIPSLILAFAQNFWYFLIAATINSLWRIVYNSWTCLLVEDTDPDQLVDIYAMIYLAEQLVAFFSPIAGLFIKRYDLIPTMRGLYLFAAVMFAVKAIFNYIVTEETEQGKVRMEETRHQSIFVGLTEMKDVLRELLRSPRTIITGGIMTILSVTALINANFWGILLTQKLNIPDENLAIFQLMRSILLLGMYFLVLPRLRKFSFKGPLLIGFAGMLVAQLLLVSAPVEGYAVLVISLLLEAGCFAMVGPLMDQMLVLTVDAKERARIQSLIYVGVILLTSPFGYIGGLLSAQNRSFPFVLNIILYGLGIVFLGMAARAAKDHGQVTKLA